MKYATKYSTKTEFSNDLNQLNELDDLWVAYVEEENKSYIKRMRTSRIKYKVESDGEYTIITRDAISYVQEAYLIEDGQKTKLTITTNRDLKANLKSGINEVDFIFKPYENASLYGAFTGTPIYELPYNCFDNFNRITNLGKIFMNCTQLKNIPIDIFKLMDSASAEDAFNGCTSLEYLPGDIFYNCSKLQQINNCFKGCSSLKEIPSELFTKCNILAMGNCFNGCISLTGSTPKYWNIFNRNIGDNCFYGCTGLTEYKEYRIPTSWGLVLPDSYLVYNISNSLGTYSTVKLATLSNKIESITILNDPDRLFEPKIQTVAQQQNIVYTPTSPENPTELYVKVEIKPDITETSSVFSNCYNLKSIPGDLFDKCTNLTSANSAFYGCKGLESIPSNLFSKCIFLRTVYRTFGNCTNKLLTTLPTSLFNLNRQIWNFSECFMGCTQLTGNCPGSTSNPGSAFNPVYYWQRSEHQEDFPYSLFGKLTGTGCFRNCTGLTQYSSIPTGWK